MKISLLGIPYDANSSFLRGPAEAPQRIREELHSDSSNGCAENGVNIRDLLSDSGDAAVSDEKNWLQISERAVTNVFESGATPFVLGGDHSVSVPSLRAYAKQFPNLTLLHFDAHPDLYEEFEGNRYSHACPFARIMEEKLVKRLVQVGIRTRNAPQQKQADRYGVEIIDMEHWTGVLPSLDSPVYISFDMDVLDPAFAPGVSHHEPGGISTREAIRAIQSISAKVVGADIVELNPRRDINGVTAVTAAKILREIAAKMLA